MYVRLGGEHTHVHHIPPIHGRRQGRERGREREERKSRRRVTTRRRKTRTTIRRKRTIRRITRKKRTMRRIGVRASRNGCESVGCQSDVQCEDGLVGGDCCLLV